MPTTQPRPPIVLCGSSLSCELIPASQHPALHPQSGITPSESHTQIKTKEIQHGSLPLLPLALCLCLTSTTSLPSQTPLPPSFPLCIMLLSIPLPSFLLLCVASRLHTPHLHAGKDKIKRSETPRQTSIFSTPSRGQIEKLTVRRND